MSFHEALRQYSKLLGDANVVTDSDALERAQTATFSTSNRIVAILFPNRQDQVVECVKIAALYKIAIYPISRGKNWGNGSRVPTMDGAILLDLHRMDRINDFDENLAYVTVEPGVTQRQLTEFLRKKRSSLAMSITGSASDSSIIGNVLERGDSTGAYGERSLYVCGFDVVLPTGEVIHTGYKRFAEAKCASIHRYGLGPSFDGLFLQSNLGIVTQMTLWLEPLPTQVDHVILNISSDEQLTVVVDALHQLALKRMMQNLTIWNDFKIFSRLQQYPFDVAKNITPLPEEIRQTMRKKYKINKWMATLSLLSFSKKQAAAQVAFVKSALKSLVTKLWIVTEDQHANALGSNVDTDENLRLAYWRKKAPPPAIKDLDVDRCGLIWCMPLVPWVGQDVAIACDMVETICLAHSFEPNIALVGTEARTLKILVAIIYDRDVEGEDEKAMACHDHLLQQLISHGYLPYRLGIHSMRAMSSKHDDYSLVWQRIKSALDPNSILAPGRYDFNPSP